MNFYAGYLKDIICVNVHLRNTNINIIGRVGYIKLTNGVISFQVDTTKVNPDCVRVTVTNNIHGKVDEIVIRFFDCFQPRPDNSMACLKSKGGVGYEWAVRPTPLETADLANEVWKYIQMWMMRL